MWSRKVLRDPLVHFLAVGLSFFILFNLVSSDNSQVDKRTIVVNENSLLEFIQFRAKAFDSERFKSQLASMSADERRQLIDDYVREEVLYREAKNMDIENYDYMIRRRLVSKIEYLTRNVSSQLVNASQEQLQVLYQQRKEEYYIEPSITFTHVFFDAQKHGWDKARQLTESQKDDFLNKSAPSFSEAAKYSDRFPYHQNYVDRSLSFIENHFGGTFARDLFAAQSSPGTWVGPIKSAYGYHLVHELKRSEGRYPAFDEVVADLSEEFKRQQTLELQNQAIQSLIDVYQVVIELPEGNVR